MDIKRKRRYILYFVIIALFAGWHYRINPGGVLLQKNIIAQHPTWKMTGTRINKEFSFKWEGYQVPLILNARTATDSAGHVHMADFTLIRKPSPAKLELDELSFTTTCCSTELGFKDGVQFDELEISGRFEATKLFFYHNMVQGKLIQLKSNDMLEPQMETSGPEGVYSLVNGVYVLDKPAKQK
ncbi:MAG: hypothetical protein V4592_07035 [Bacteroidota bacterium]